MASINPADEISDQPEAKRVKLDVTDDAAVETATIDAADEIDGQPDAKRPKLDTVDGAVFGQPAGDGNGPSEPVKTALEQNIIDQVEYYFSDANLFRDKFLQKITKDSSWVPVSTLVTFKRLAALSEDIAVIVDALDKSDSGLLEISEDRQSIRRHPERPVPEKNEETRKEMISRTAYVKGFPKELEMEEYLEFFKAYPKVAHLVIRKYLDKPTKTYQSKGSVFVSFETRDQCAEFLSQDVKYKDGELITKWQSDYYAGKKAERQEKHNERKAKADPEIELPKGTVLYITEIKPETTRELIKETVEGLEGEVAFVDFAKGNETAYVRLSKENSAKEFLGKLEAGKLKLAEGDTSVAVLEGDVEEKYLAECVEKMKLRRQNCHGKKKHNNRKPRN